ncbi:hypothetical protein PV328_011841, partial [Microctonus aethiopoides]
MDGFVRENLGKRVLKAVRRKLLFEDFYWRNVSKRFLCITGWLDVGSSLWFRRSADDYEQPDVDEEVEDNGEVPGVEDREARRRDALHLVNALGCTKLSDEFYFDFVGIEWLHLGRWGENHP